MERLQKIIADYGYASRRKAEELIKSGRVKVNGKIVQELGTKATKNDIITIDAVNINKEIIRKVYILNKPREVICSVKDELIYFWSTMLTY